MAQVRALYEDTAVPVRDIARRAGVAERTLYKYAQKHSWKPRYAWTPDGSRPPGRPGRRRSSEQRARAERFAPAKGAGGRFIRREDKGQPVAQGIKALDPAGRAAAAQAAAEAERVARRAKAEADAEVQLQKHLRIMETVSLACAEYGRFQRDRAPARSGAVRSPSLEPSHRPHRDCDAKLGVVHRARRSGHRRHRTAVTRRRPPRAGHIRVFGAVMSWRQGLAALSGTAHSRCPFAVLATAGRLRH